MSKCCGFFCSKGENMECIPWWYIKQAGEISIKDSDSRPHICIDRQPGDYRTIYYSDKNDAKDDLKRIMEKLNGDDMEINRPN